MVADFSKKSKDELSRKKIFLQIGCIIALAILVILIVADVKIYFDKKEMIAKINSYQSQIDGVKSSNEHLRAEISNADSKDYLEQMAYEQLDKHRPGEQEIIFVSAPESDKASDSPKSYWTGWIGGVFNWIKDKF